MSEIRPSTEYAASWKVSGIRSRTSRTKSDRPRELPRDCSGSFLIPGTATFQAVQTSVCSVFTIPLASVYPEQHHGVDDSDKFNDKQASFRLFETLLRLLTQMAAVWIPKQHTSPKKPP